jgi:hypothetical protein
MKKLLVKNIGKTRIEYLFHTENGKNLINQRSTRGKALLHDRQMEVTTEFGNNLYMNLLKEGYAKFDI